MSWRDKKIESSWQPGFDEAGLALQETIFVIVDLETTGSAPTAGNGITEIGAVKVIGGELIGEFNTFVNPGIQLPEFITKLTGITDAMLSEAPDIHAVFPSFLEFAGSHTEVFLVAHNAPFDMGFLKAAAKIAGYEWPQYRVLDTVSLARLLVGYDEVPNYKLGTLATFFNTEVSPNHRALDDAKATVEVLHGLLERLGSHDVTTVDNLLQFLKRIPEKKPKFN
jgi:DNA polymerase III epsilon subunit family exonuclease